MLYLFSIAGEVNNLYFSPANFSSFLIVDYAKKILKCPLKSCISILGIDFPFKILSYNLIQGNAYVNTFPSVFFFSLTELSIALKMAVPLAVSMWNHLIEITIGD